MKEELDSAKPTQSLNEWRQKDYILVIVVGIVAMFTLIDAVRRVYKMYRVSRAWAKEQEEIKAEQAQAFKEQIAQEKKAQEGTVAQPKQPELKKND